MILIETSARFSARAFQITLLCLSLTALGCRAAAPSADFAGEARELRRSPGRMMVRTELFFGLGRADGSEIGDQHWLAFVRDEITPRFASGVTILEARGQWRDQHGVQREPSRVVIILHDGSDLSDSHIEQIRQNYKQRFGQESVLRSDSIDKVSF